MKPVARIYNKRQTAKVAAFTEHFRQHAARNGTFDSASAQDFMCTALNQSTRSPVPEKLQIVLDEADDRQSALVNRVLYDSLAEYEREHGASAPADLVEQAIHMAWATTEHARNTALKRGSALDSASNEHHDPHSLQPNRAVLGILTAFTDPCPFAHYLPADIHSNEAILAILSHQAGSTWGAYSQGELLDGANGGRNYISTARLHRCYADASGTINGALTAVQTNADSCDPNATPVPLLRGRSQVYIGGQMVAREMEATGTGNSVVSGRVNVAGTEYVIGGTIQPENGRFALTSTPPLPDTVDVLVEGFVDYEKRPELTPSIHTAVDTFRLYAKPWRVTTHTTIDSRTQISAELGMDPYSESLIAIQNQFAAERHYEVLEKARRLAAHNAHQFNFNAGVRLQEMNRAEIWQDFSATVAAASHQMAIDTIGHGITHLYVGPKVAADLQGMPRTLFEPSGLPPRAGIYRLGRLFGQYEVYFCPRLLENPAHPTTARVLAIGRAHDVARNPFVLGDAVPPTVNPIAMGQDMRQGSAFYARNFTSVNPHAPSAKGAAMIEIINL